MLVDSLVDGWRLVFCCRSAGCQTFGLSVFEGSKLHRILHRLAIVRSPRKMFSLPVAKVSLPVARVRELHRILHRLPASGAYCGLLAVLG